MEIFSKISEVINKLIETLGSNGALLGCVFILVESIIPVLPLAVFITLNFITFGSFWGFIISWIFTVIGCMVSFYIFRRGFNKWFNKLIKDKEKLHNLMIMVDNISLGQLVVILAIPFTPASLVNVAAGLSNIEPKKYLLALIIGKISLVYFWGYIGVSLIESLTNPVILLKILVIVVVLYLVSRLIGKKINY